jgi:hypothetical protein
MAITSALRTPIRRILARERLEVVEQRARQATELGRFGVERIEALEQAVAGLTGEIAEVRARVDQLHDAVVTSDPAVTREIVSAVRDDVQRLVVEVNRLLDDPVRSA